MAGRATLTMVTSMLRMSTLMQQIARIRFGRVAGFELWDAVLLVVPAVGRERFSAFSKVSPLNGCEPGRKDEKGQLGG
jgi:hypothetical protein